MHTVYARSLVHFSFVSIPWKLDNTSWTYSSITNNKNSKPLQCLRSCIKLVSDPRFPRSLCSPAALSCLLVAGAGNNGAGIVHGPGHHVRADGGWAAPLHELPAVLAVQAGDLRHGVKVANLGAEVVAGGPWCHQIVLRWEARVRAHALVYRAPLQLGLCGLGPTLLVLEMCGRSTEYDSLQGLYPAHFATDTGLIPETKITRNENNKLSAHCTRSMNAILCRMSFHLYGINVENQG